MNINQSRQSKVLSDLSQQNFILVHFQVQKHPKLLKHPKAYLNNINAGQSPTAIRDGDQPVVDFMLFSMKSKVS
jgi:hypothetical protein